MSRPVIRWLLFLLCLAVFAGALVWISQRMLRMETERREAEREAQVQERVRLALWRMESVASTLLIRENARPPFQYQAFYEPDDLYTPGNEPIPRGQIRTPSPLMGAPPDLVRLHFELLQSPPMLCSPQVPIGKDAALAQAWYVHPSSRAAQSLLDDLQTLIHQRPDLFQLDAAKAPAKEKEVAAAVPTKPQMDQAAAQTLDQGLANTREFQQRSTLVTQNVIQEKSEAFKVPLKKAAPSQVSRAASDATAESAAGAMAAEAAPPSRAAALPTPTFAGDLRGEWIGENLFLLRQAELQAQKRLQGVWVDWAALQQRLIEAVKDLFPDASLRPAAASERSDPDTLVTLPIKLLTGSTAISLPPANRAVLRTLALAWISFGIAALAIAFVLQRALTLSERRGAFVSAVTHELRTPLTTFQLYSEMLADDMVRDPTTRKEYLQTLHSESGRLMHLVENVLSFSRIERGRTAAREESVTAGALLDRMLPRLQQRAQSAQLELTTHRQPEADQALLRVDPLAVEQILTNLVDNACKYAAPAASQPLLELTVERDGPSLAITLQDHGPGLSAAQRKKLFQPFAKSASEAAHSAPGIGLGLALSKRLARELGGDLRLRSSNSGARFTLTLPLQSA